MDKMLILWATLILISGRLSAQLPFVFALGGSGEEEARRAVSTPNGGYIAVGYIAAGGGIVHGNGARDGLVFKMDPSGNVLWAEAIGGNAADEFVDIAFYKGYYYCVGHTKSWLKKDTLPGYSDIFLVKIKENGDVVWAKHFGHPTGAAQQLSDEGFGITATAMSGVILIGVNGSGNGTESDIVAIRVSESGKIGFAKSYSTNDFLPEYGADLARDILRDVNGFVITAGIPGGVSDRDGLVYKIDISGGVKWSRRIDAAPSFAKVDVPETSVYNPSTKKIVAGGLEEKLTTETDPIIYQLDSNGVYGGAGKFFSVSNNDRRRGRLFARGDGGNGYLFPLYAAGNASVAARKNMDAIVFSLDNNLAPTGQVQIGWPESYDFLNHVVSCENESDVLGLGGTWYPEPPGATVKTNILVSRFTMTIGQVGFCGSNTNWNSFTPSDVNNTQLLQVADLPPNYATDDLIDSFPSPIDVKNYLVKFPCPVASPLPPPNYGMAFSNVENFQTTVLPVECNMPDCSKNLVFDIGKKLISVEFKIMDSNEFILFETEDQDVLAAGIKYDELKMPTGEYFWELRSVYPDGAIEYKNGEFSIK